MNTVDFINWLITSKNLSNRSAKDVVSRCKRISKLNNDTEIDKVNYEIFIKSEVFLSQTIFIKSQLKRQLSFFFSRPINRVEQLCALEDIADVALVLSAFQTRVQKIRILQSVHIGDLIVGAVG
jgi:hypothetical protein